MNAFIERAAIIVLEVISRVIPIAAVLAVAPIVIGVAGMFFFAFPCLTFSFFAFAYAADVSSEENAR